MNIVGFYCLLIDFLFCSRIQIHFHSNMDNFYNYIPRESMPVDLGGTYSHTKAELSRKFMCYLVK